MKFAQKFNYVYLLWELYVFVISAICVFETLWNKNGIIE